MNILHTADLHINHDTYGRPDPATGQSSRLIDRHQVWMYVCRTAVERHVDLVVIPGDLFENHRPLPHQFLRLMDGLTYLSENKIPAVIIPGNHDQPKETTETVADLIASYRLPGITVSVRPEVIHLPGLEVCTLPAFNKAKFLAAHQELAGEGAAAVYAAMSAAGVDVIRWLASQCQPGLPTVLMAHENVDAAIMDSGQSSLTLDEVVLPLVELAGRFTYTALGHIHKAQILAPGVAYSGAPERSTFGEEADTKGCWLVTIPEGKPDGECAMEFIPTPARPFKTFTVTAAEVLADEWRPEVPAGAIVRVRGTGTEEECRKVNIPVVVKNLTAAGASFVGEVSFEPDTTATRVRDSEMTVDMDIHQQLDRLLAVQRPDLKQYADELHAMMAEVEGEVAASDPG